MRAYTTVKTVSDRLVNKGYLTTRPAFTTEEGNPSYKNKYLLKRSYRQYLLDYLEEVDYLFLDKEGVTALIDDKFKY